MTETTGRTGTEPPRPAITAVAERPWHALEADAALAAFHTSHHGLEPAEAAARIAVFGPNRLPRTSGRGAFVRFLLQFNNVLIYVLLAAAVLSAALGHWIDAAVVLGVTLANAIIGFIQEGRAAQALEAIRGMIDPRATVLRDGHRATIGADEIVPGDIVLVEAGARVPADLRLMRARGLRIDEADADRRVGARRQDPGAGDERRAARRPAIDGLFRNLRHRRTGIRRGCRHRIEDRARPHQHADRLRRSRCRRRSSFRSTVSAGN